MANGAAGDGWRLRRGVVVHALDDALIVTSERRSVLLEGLALGQVAALLDQGRSTEQLVDLIGPQVGSGAVTEAVDRLHRAGHVISGRPPVDDAATYLEGCFRISTSSDIGKLTVGIAGYGEAEPYAETVAAALTRLGCRTRLIETEGMWSGDVGVVLVSDYLDPRLAHVNAHMRDEGRPWLLAKPIGQLAWIGPRFVPGETGCWACLATRLSENRHVERFVADTLRLPYPARPAAGLLPGVDGMIAAMIGADLLASLTGRSPLTGRLRVVDLTDFAMSHHELTRLPHCAECGEPSRARPDSRAAGSMLGDGAVDRPWQRRLLSAGEVTERLSRQISPYLGAVSRLERAPANGTGSGYTYLAQHGFPTIGRDLRTLRHTLSMRSVGRGSRPRDARSAAMCEAMERYCGAWVDGTRTVRSSLRELGQRAVHPEDILLYSERQYKARAVAGEVGAFERVPERFDIDRRIDFTEAWSLTEAEPVLVPAGLVWYGHPDLRDHPYAYTDSNGCAAGGDLTEATFHALCELYERDAVAIWWYNRTQAPRVDLDELADPFCADLISSWARIGRSGWVLDITTDLSMPTFVAVTADGVGGRVLCGFAAHPDARRAIRRAMAESDQLLPLIDLVRTRRSSNADAQELTVRRWLNGVTCADEPWLMPATEGSAQQNASNRIFEGESLAAVIAGLVEELRLTGIETLVVDQTRPDVDIAVARVICPGLRHFWRRTAPGRLYDVPAARGFDRLAEDQLNPYSVFI